MTRAVRNFLLKMVRNFIKPNSPCIILNSRFVNKAHYPFIYKPATLFVKEGGECVNQRQPTRWVLVGFVMPSFSPFSLLSFHSPLLLKTTPLLKREGVYKKFLS